MDYGRASPGRRGYLIQTRANVKGRDMAKKKVVNALLPPNPETNPEEWERWLFQTDPDFALDLYRTARKSLADARRIMEGGAALLIRQDADIKKWKRDYNKLEEKDTEIMRGVQKRMKALNENRKRGAENNQERAARFLKTVSDYVTGRLKRNSYLTPEELANEIQRSAWAARNKRGDRRSKAELVKLCRRLKQAAIPKIRSES